MRKSVSVFGFFAVVLIFCVSLSFALAPSGIIVFVDESLRMTPTIAQDNTRVTLTFQVRNNGPRIANVQIRVMEPVNERGEGRVLVDVPRQVLTVGSIHTVYPGTSSFPVTTPRSTS